MPLRRRLAVLAFAVLALGAAPARARLAPGDYERTLAVGGLQRSYRVHVPPGYDGATAVPLVVDLHGLTSNAVQQRGISGMVAVSDANGFLVVHPDGVRNAWNAKLCCGNQGIDDVGFIRAVVDAVAGETPVDRRRVYVTGLSNGGAMSHRLACDAADVVAAAAPMAFPLADVPATGCQPSRSIPVLTVMGLTDTLVRYDGGFGSAADTFGYWREVNGCGAGAPEVTDVRGQSRCEHDTSCANGVEVGLCSVTARAFGGSFFDGHVLYLNDDYVLAQVAWDFLSRFRLPENAAAAVEARLTGPDRLKLGSGVPRRGRPAALDWTVRLGAGTWAAAGDGVSLGGSWRRVRGRTGSGVGALTTAARAQLEAVVMARIAAITGTSGPLVGLEPVGPIRLGFDRTGKPSSISGRWRLLRGGVPDAVIGRYALRLRRAR